MKEVKFQANLKSLRTASGLGQKELANTLQTSVKTVSHWETGYSEPNITQLAQLAEIFGISMDELIFG